MKSGSARLFAILFGLPLVLVVPVALLGASVFQAGTIDLEVLEKGEDGMSLGVTVPGALVPVAMRFIPECTIDDVRCEIGAEGRAAIRMAEAALQSLRGAPDGVYVDVRTQDEIVRVEKKGNRFHLYVDTPDECIRASVPSRVASQVLAAL
ncbi:hypothetical protein K8I85_02125 [bacterium]|nr:hypothetical protein [bacterium]